MRKLLMLAAMALAALAVAAPPAAATSPDFPHDDTDAGSWRGVVVMDNAGHWCEGASCSISAGGTWQWFYNGVNIAYFSDCTSASLEGSVSADGSVSLADIEFGNSSFSGSNFCAYFEALDLPAEGQICQNVDTGEFWLRQGLEIDTYPGALGVELDGALFGELTGPGNEDVISPDQIDVNSGDPWPTDQYQYFATHPGTSATWESKLAWSIPDGLNVISSNSASNEYTGVEEPCGWPELS